MVLCKLCGIKTTGSIGAAGYTWSFICQSCKNKEDSAALARFTAENKVIDSLLAVMFKSTDLTKFN